MSAPRLSVLIPVLIIAFLQVAAAQETTAPTVEEPALTEADKQISVNRATLRGEGQEKQMRVAAATLLLFSDIPGARKEVIQVLRDEANPDARAAVCQALIAAREDKKPVANKVEFIEPLMAVLRTETDPTRAELAAQALLMFAYDDIRGNLEGLLGDPNVSQTARLNAVRTLKYQPDDRAIFKLADLLGGPDPNLALESRKALELLGLEVPTDPNGIRAMTDALRRRGPEAFLRNPLILRNWLVSRENRIVELRAAVTAWEGQYKAALGRLYALQADEKAKSEFLAQQLSSPEPSVKLWALGKLEEVQKGTDQLKLSEQLGGILLSLISNRDRQVRLATAKLLELIWELDSTKQLLKQLEVEEDAEVRQGLFVTLGKVCYYASLPASPVKVPDEVRKKTLELAAGFLKQADPTSIRSGADVIRKLLEQDGLTAEEVDRYLNAIAERYRQVGPTANHGLRAELVGAMAGLCAQRSSCRAEAARLYGPVFEQALADGADGVRQAAVDGLINIDRAAALKRLRSDFVKDVNPAIRMKLIELAGEIGGQEDLAWLSQKIGQNGEAEPAWQAMLKVFRRSDSGTLGKWMAEFESPTAQIGLSAERRMAFLAVVEQKAKADNDVERLEVVWARLFALYARSNDPARATEYMNSLFAAAGDDQSRQAMVASLVDVCLGSPVSQVDLVGNIVEKYLSEEDLGSDSSIARSINGYLNQPPEGADPNALLARLRRIEVKEPEKRSLWRGLLTEWESFAKAKGPDAAEKVNN